MRKPVQQVVAFAAALLLVASSLVGAATLGVGGVDHIDDINPIGESEAVAPVVAAGLAGIAVGSIAAEAFFGDTPNGSELQAEDALETEKNVYQGAITQGQNNEILGDSYSNYLQDTETVAKMEAKNAYIRALNNGSSEAIARSKAREAAADYYSAKQVQRLNTFEVSMNYTHTLRKQLQSAGADPGLVYLNYTLDPDSGGSVTNVSSWQATNNVTLANGTTVSYQSASVALDNQNSGGGDSIVLGVTEADYAGFNDNSGPGTTIDLGSSAKATFHSVDVAPPTDNYAAQSYLQLDDTVQMWSEIEAQNDNVQAQLDTFVNNTYSAYQSGEISEEDLVDPYLGAREYSPDAQYDTWALRSLTSMGVQPPENMSTIGRMNITDHRTGEQFTGTLMSDGIPQSGSFELGTRYDSEELTGYQFIVDGDSETSHELTGNFTLTAVHYPNGTAKNVSSVDYNTINYQTTSIEEYKDQLAQLQETTAEINARQQKMRNSGGGVGWLPNFGGLGGFGGGLLTGGLAGIVVAIIAVVAILALLYPMLGPMLLS